MAKYLEMLNLVHMNRVVPASPWHLSECGPSNGDRKQIHPQICADIPIYFLLQGAPYLYANGRTHEIYSFGKNSNYSFATVDSRSWWVKRKVSWFLCRFVVLKTHKSSIPFIEPTCASCSVGSYASLSVGLSGFLGPTLSFFYTGAEWSIVVLGFAKYSRRSKSVIHRYVNCLDFGGTVPILAHMSRCHACGRGHS